MDIPIDPRAKAFIFDIDGTLADTMPLHYLAWREVAGKHGFDFSEDEYYALAGIPTKKIVNILNERHGLSFNEDTIKEKEAAFERNLHQVKPIELVVEIVHKYKDKIPMSLGTGGSRYFAELTIKAIGLDGVIDIMVTANDVEHHKPFPDTFLECARRMGVKPEECLVFEDGEPGLEAARRGGMIPLDVRPFLVK